MDREQLAGLFGMYSEAVIAVGGNVIVYYNAAAKRLLPGIEKLTPGDIFPDAVLELTADNFAGELDIAGKRSTYSAARCGEYRIFSLLSDNTVGERINSAAFAAMSMEMKSYLAVLNLAAGIVLPYVENSGDDRLGTYAAMINKSYYNILRLTSNMEILGTEPALIKLKRTVFDLTELCAELVSVCSHLIGDSGVKLSLNCPKEDIIVSADKDKISQMLLNMISNSLIYTGDGGNVCLSVSQTSNCALIKVADTGEGIPDDVKASAWNRYAELKQLSDTKSGAGFGMAAISQIARMHGGSVFFESRRGEGTTVAASIPLARPESSAFRVEPEVYRSKGVQPYLTGLSTVIDNNKYSQKYMD